ncbi:MAG TPA: F0F1 ATP synthase subunit A [Ruminiclostridium sp.]|nr:F0F1 ATP synthase subunit A [Ruminiclostridium sp.]
MIKLDTSKAFESSNLFTIHISGLDIPIANSIVMMWIIMAVLITLSIVFTRDLKTVPTGKQNIAEIVIETITKLIKGNMGHHGKDFVPYFGTILLFLAFANISGIFNIFPTGEDMYKLTGLAFFRSLPEFSIDPPTKDLNLTVTMALMTVSLVLLAGIKYKGIKGFLRSFLKPIPVMLPFHILDYGTRTASLSLRLFGNILAGYIIMEILYTGVIFVKPLIPLASFFFDIFDAGLQAYIFVFLSSVYISEAIE